MVRTVTHICRACNYSKSTVITSELQPLWPVWQLCTDVWCNSHFYFPAILPWWKLEYCACRASPMQCAKFHSTERPPFMDSQRQRITSCAQRRVTLYLLWYSFPHAFLQLVFSSCNQHYQRCWIQALYSHPGLCFTMTFGIVSSPVWMWQKESPESAKIPFWFNLTCTYWDGKLSCSQATAERS